LCQPPLAVIAALDEYDLKGAVSPHQ
jgi:hypothetical protein